MMSNHRPTVLILASDPAFARDITASWPQDPVPGSDRQSDRPEFIVLDEAFSRDLGGNHYDLAIADASSSASSLKRKDKTPDRRPDHELKLSLAAAGKPAIIIHSKPGSDFYSLHGSVIGLRREPEIWAALAGLLAREILRRRQAEAHALESETISIAAQAEATLGRYMVEMRSNVNNALTTVLGNAELLALEPGLPATVQAQTDTIRNMALRLHEIFQRFSSLEKELKVAARESGKQSARAAGHI
jgi:signal transduction histidine kinase